MVFLHRSYCVDERWRCTCVIKVVYIHDILSFKEVFSACSRNNVGLGFAALYSQRFYGCFYLSILRCSSSSKKVSLWLLFSRLWLLLSRLQEQEGPTVAEQVKNWEISAWPHCWLTLWSFQCLWKALRPWVVSLLCLIRPILFTACSGNNVLIASLRITFTSGHVFALEDSHHKARQRWQEVCPQFRVVGFTRIAQQGMQEKSLVELWRLVSKAGSPSADISISFCNFTSLSTFVLCTFPSLSAFSLCIFTVSSTSSYDFSYFPFEACKA